MDFLPQRERVIGYHEGTPGGPLLIVIGGIHGNEHAGVEALASVCKLLGQEPEKNPDFAYQGTFLALRGNLKALRLNARFLDRDLNRIMTQSHVNAVLSAQPSALEAEDEELYYLIRTIEAAVRHYKPSKLIAMDIHTTSAKGGIFSIVSEDPESLSIATNFHAPVILGMMDGITGTSIHHFSSGHYGLPTIGVVFEAGQHRGSHSIGNAISAVVNCMRTIGSVRPDDVENKHDERLIRWSARLPNVARLITKHTIGPFDEFEMLPGYSNFSAVQKGQLLAHDIRGPIRAATDGLILMPLYQKQGSDGFFLIQAQNEATCRAVSKA
ncbi:MAG: succinylglutamate desuccinylase/aspartoacylase family protein [Bacteroidota bacterium]